jgi:predicted metal-binding membrane protein
VEWQLDGTTRAATALAAVAASGWVVTATAEGSMDLGPAPFLGAWTAMMAAMMLPSAAPLVLLYRRGTTPGRTAALASGYLAVWAALGVFAYLYMESELMVAAWLVFGAAGLYQLTPMKTACLRRCRTPVDFLLTRFGRSPLRLGLEHAAWCAGCCWALMLVLVVAGSMGIGWALGIAAVVFVEKLAPGGQHFARATGIALLALALTEGALGWPGI